MIGLRVILLYYVITMLMLTTSLVDLTDALELMFLPLQRVRVPVNELTLVSVIAMKFVPIFIGELERLARAQTARGISFEGGGPINRARRVGRLLIPIFLSGFRRADVLTMAMDTRSDRGWQPIVEEVAPGRPNVVCVIEGGAGPGPTLLFEGHTDVVTEGDPAEWH